MAEATCCAMDDDRAYRAGEASNAFSVYLVKQRIEFLHTKANKLTGLLLFIGLMAIGQSYFIPVAWGVACIALFAAIQECNATLRPLG